MRPRFYRLNTNKGTEAPSNLFFFDSESHEPRYYADGTIREHELRLWTAIGLRLEGGKVTRRQVYRGHTPEEFFAALDTRIDRWRPLWAFAHNLGHDLTQLDFWSRLHARRYTVGPVDTGLKRKDGKPRKPWEGRLCLESRPQFAIVRNAVGVVKFVDSGNYWPTALASIGEAHNLPKLDMPAWAAPDDDWFHYCQRDSEVLEVAVCELLRWWVKERCGVFQLTAPQLSLTNWKHTTQCRSADGEKVEVVFDREAPSLDLERAAYYGPKFQPYFVGKIEHPVYELDVNSMFLAVMARELFPRRRIGDHVSTDPEELRRKLRCYGGAASVRINARGNTYPVRRDGQQVHATGIFWTQLCGPELARALEAGDVDEVGSVQLFAMADLFSNWARTWYDRKLNARRKGPRFAGELEFAKLIGVSLYGKFGQHGRFWNDRLDLGYEPLYRRWCKWELGQERPVHFRAVAGVIQEQVEGHTPLHGFPAISGFVTAHAREWLRGVVQSLPPETVYYEGSDSILCDEVAYGKLRKAGLVHADRLGAFRLVAVHQGGTIKGPNNYTVGSKVVRAGLHGRVRPNADGKLVSDRWQTLADILYTEPDGKIRVVEVPFTDTQSAPKGKRSKTGWVKPYWFTPDPEFGDQFPRSGRSSRPRPRPASSSRPS